MSKATVDGTLWKPTQLNVRIRKEWVRNCARTHVDLNYDNRLKCAFEVFEHIMQGRPIVDWEIERGGGGNWDVSSIEAIGYRIGCDLNISSVVETAAKRHFRDEKNAFEFVKDLRNRLAHGSISFEQSGENVTFGDLKDLKQITVDYLRQVVTCFRDYLDGRGYLETASRPSEGGPR